MSECAFQHTCTRAQVLDSLKQRHNGQSYDTRFFTKELHFQQVAQCTCHANDVAGYRVTAELLARLANRIERCKYVRGLCAQLQLMTRQHAQSSKVETKDLYLAYECCQCSSRYILLTICQQALTHQLKISQ